MSVPYPCCSICSGPYVADIKVARILPCGDSFCEDCLVKDSNLTNCHECQAQNTKSLVDCPINRGLMKSAKLDKASDELDEDSFSRILDRDKVEKRIEILPTQHNLLKEMEHLEEYINKQRFMIKLSEMKIDYATERWTKCKSDYVYLYKEEENIKLNKENKSFNENFDNIKKLMSRYTKQQEVVRDSIKSLRDKKVLRWVSGQWCGLLTSDDDGSLNLHRGMLQANIAGVALDALLHKPYSQATLTFIRTSVDTSRRVYFHVDGSHQYGEQFIEWCVGINGWVGQHELEEDYYRIWKVCKSPGVFNGPCDLTVQAMNKGDLFIGEDEGTVTYGVCRKDGAMEGKYLGKVVSGYSYLEQNHGSASITAFDSGVVLFKTN